MLKKLLKKKDTARVVDSLKIFGGTKSTRGGIFMDDGSPVPVELIMEQFGVSQDEAERIVRERTR